MGKKMKKKWEKPIVTALLRDRSGSAESVLAGCKWIQTADGPGYVYKTCYSSGVYYCITRCYAGAES
jgi:hypothetical protein